MMHLDPEMSLNAYQKGALRTAIYPGSGTAIGLSYCALKLNGKAGEFAEHLGKAIRDDGLIQALDSIESTFVSAGLTLERKELLIKELGDVLWYIAAAANELGVSLQDIAEMNLLKLSKRAREGKLSGSGDTR